MCAGRRQRRNGHRRCCSDVVHGRCIAQRTAEISVRKVQPVDNRQPGNPAPGLTVQSTGVHVTQQSQCSLGFTSHSSQNAHWGSRHTAVTMLTGVQVTQQSQCSLGFTSHSSQNAHWGSSHPAVTMLAGVHVTQQSQCSLAFTSHSSQNARWGSSHTAVTMLTKASRHTAVTMLTGV